MQACKDIALALNLLPVAKPVITVAGTNGKGSCVALCEAILLAQGYRVGSFFSPHLFHFNERICINHKPVREDLIQAAFHMIEHASSNSDLTYFEKITLAALIIFKNTELDVYVLEVGLGGRYDPTNIVDADVAVVTSIDLDHTNILGNTREQIGFEKAGILRSHKPAIYGGDDMPDSIKNHAAQIDAKLYRYQQDYFFREDKETWSWWDKQKSYHDLPKPHLLLQNAATAIAALQHFSLPVSEDAIKAGLKIVFLPGRFQIIDKPIQQIFDVAHNPAAAKLLASRIKELPCKGKTIAVVGMLKDKDIASTFSPMISIVDEWYLGSLIGERGASAHVLAKELEVAAEASPQRSINISPFLFNNVRNAYDAAIATAKPHDRIIIFGSFHTVGDLLANKT